MIDIADITVVITTYNNKVEEVQATIFSCEECGYTKIKLYDDGSTNNWLDNPLNLRIRDFNVEKSETNNGVMRARLNSLTGVTTPYVIFAGSGDRFLDAISCQDDGFDVCFSNKLSLMGRNLLAPLSYEDVIKRYGPYFLGSLIKTDVARSVLSGTPSYYSSDTLLTLKLIKNYVVSIGSTYSYDYLHSRNKSKKNQPWHIFYNLTNFFASENMTAAEQDLFISFAMKYYNAIGTNYGSS